MKMSASIAAIAAALAKAQGEIKNAGRDAANPFFKSKYAPLDTVIDNVKEALSKNGIAYFQTATSDGPKVSLLTLLMHSSGEWIEGDPLAATGKDAGAQTIGSVCTYLRRYGLMAAVGIAATDDDDAEAAEGRPQPAAQPPKTNADKVKEKVTAATGNGKTHPEVPATPELRKSAIKGRMGAIGLKAPAEMAAKLGEWLGRPVDGSTVFSEADFLAVVSEIEKARQSAETLAKARANMEAAGLGGTA